MKEVGDHVIKVVNRKRSGKIRVGPVNDLHVVSGTSGWLVKPNVGP